MMSISNEQLRSLAETNKRVTLPIDWVKLLAKELLARRTSTCESEEIQKLREALTTIKNKKWADEPPSVYMICCEALGHCAHDEDGPHGVCSKCGEA